MSLSDYDKTWTIVSQRSDKQSSLKQEDRPDDDEKNNASKVTTDPTNQSGEEKASDDDTVPVNEDRSDDEDDGHKPILEIMDVTEMETQTGQSIVTRTRRFRKPKNRGKDRFSDYAGVMRRRLNEMGRPISSTLEIKSPYLQEALKVIFKDIEGINLEASPIIIRQPYAPLFWRKARIEEYRKEKSHRSVAKELDVILQFINDNHDLDRIQTEYHKHEPQKMIISAIVWTLFPPGTLAVFNMPSMPTQCIKITNTIYNQKTNVLELRFVLFQWNGRQFGQTRRSIAFELPMTPAPFPITELLVYPLKYHPREELRQKLITRGRKYAKIVQRAHMDYRGVAWVQDPFEETTLQCHIAGRVMIDYAQYTRQNPSSAAKLETDLGMEFEECEMTPCYCGKPGCTIGAREKDEEEPKAKKLAVEDHEQKKLEDEQALLCPGLVKGFALADKCWAEFKVDALEEIKWNKQAYGRLEMDPDRKSIIRALVESHRKHSTVDPAEFDDIIVGKGLGLVLLLQGPPGLGKTLTAESVAEQAHKPIYAVTSGELGTTVNEMEAALKAAFRIAKEWNAILLLDEADVFLSKRSTENLEKNAFVSVFLRLMEYYQGILFLTTNRAEDFDPAFLSRIHVTIEYEPLTPQRRANVWHNLAEKMTRDSSLESPEVWETLGREYEINGREIKNVLRTAYCLAKEDNQPLKLELIRKVLELNPRFKIHSPP